MIGADKSEYRAEGKRRPMGWMKMEGKTDFSGLNLLITDDNRLYGELIAELLSVKNAKVSLARSGAEAVRMLPYLRKGGMVVVNSHPIMPVTAALQGTDYTGAEMVAYLREHAEHVLVLDGQRAVEAIGNPKTLNVIMLGAALASGALDFLTEEDVLAAIRQKVKPKFVTLNEKALRCASSLV